MSAPTDLRFKAFQYACLKASPLPKYNVSALYKLLAVFEAVLELLKIFTYCVGYFATNNNSSFVAFFPNIL